MGIFDFLRGAGRNVKRGNETAEIKDIITTALGDRISGLNVSYKDGTATLFGSARSQADREKAVLLAGNIKDVDKVDDQLTVSAQSPQEQVAAARTEKAPAFVTIEKGDTLSKIAQQHYGDANRWRELFEANREVIEDPDKIYPGQTIRVPQG